MYPIYLDAREILVDIQIRPPFNPQNAFKIVSNDKYIFVGSDVGIHVFKKDDGFPLNFIQINHLKAFDVVGNLLFANNFVDLLVIDVEDPANARILHRERDFFNRYINSGFNLPVVHNQSINANVYEIGQKWVNVTVTITDANPDPDFSEVDEYYRSFTVTQIHQHIPHAVHQDIQLHGRPHVGIINVEGNIYTLGNNGLMRLSYTSGGLTTSQSSNIPDYWQVMPTSNLQYKDGMVFIIGNSGFVHLDYPNQNSTFRQWWGVMDVVSIQVPANSFVVLGNTILSLLDAPGGMGGTWGATSIINVDDTILALGSALTLHRLSWQENWWSWVFQQVGLYQNISGSAMLRDGDRLFVAHSWQGLLVYDISDLDNIILIQ